MSRQQQLLDAAVQVFADRGFEAATVDQVAVAAGVSVGTLYNYFTSKEEILRGIVLREFATRRGFMSLNDRSRSASDTIPTFITRHLHQALSSPSASRVVMQEKRLIQRWQEHGQLSAQGMKTLLEELLVKETSAERAEVLAVMLHGAVEGLTLYLMQLPKEDALCKVEDLMPFFRDFVLQGLR